MRFSCDNCGRSYVASDEVAGRAFRMRCKECGEEVVVRPPRSTASPFAPPAHADGASGAPMTAPRRRAFDPFEGEENPAGDVAVSDEALEILERTPPPRPIPRPPRTATPASPASAARPAPPVVRPGRVLPAEDEAMLGPPGAEARRSLPRWVILIALGALAIAGGLVFLR